MTASLATVWRLARFVTSHPANRGRPVQGLARVLRWQLGSRLLSSPVIMEWVNGSRLIVKKGMAAATGNLYFGLFEYADMAFLLHFLRPDELFVDVGANVGSFTVLASAACGARAISFEPVPATFEELLDNVALNRCEGRVRTLNVAVGAHTGEVYFTADRDAMNHALTCEDNTDGAVLVPVRPLDDVLADEHPALIKVDVEGYEDRVVEGGTRALSRVDALIIELRGGSGAAGDAILCEKLRHLGLKSVRYDPDSRSLQASEADSRGGNVLFVRDLEHAQRRVREAPKFRIVGRYL